jgi:hypothetical protein
VAPGCSGPKAEGGVREDKHGYVVCFLLSNSPASEVYMPTFRNTVPSSQAGRRVYTHTHAYLPVKMEQSFVVVVPCISINIKVFLTNKGTLDVSYFNKMQMSCYYRTTTLTIF